MRRSDGDKSAAPWSSADYDPGAEGQAFDRRIKERVDAGFVPDLRRAVHCEHFYKSFWRDPHFVALYLGPIARAYLDALAAWSRPGAAILDVGCGAGYFSLELARAGHHVTAIDVSAESIAAARHTLADNPFLEGFGSLDYQCCDFAHVSGTFDAVIFSGSLHHFPAVERVIDRAATLIRPGGLLICYEPIHEAFREQDAAQAFLIRALLSLTGFWYEAPATLGIDGSDDAPDLGAAVQAGIAAVHREYVQERDPSEQGGQSPHDLESSGAEILTELRARFEELAYRPMVSFNHRMLGGLRGPDATVKQLADLLTAYEKLGLARGQLGPNCFFFVGRR